MSCNLATTQAAACVSGIGKLTDPLSLLQVIAENFAESAFASNSANTNSIDAIRARACTSGIGKITDELALWRIIAQNLCALANNDVPATVISMTSISPNPLSKFGSQSVTITGVGFSSVLSPTLTFPESGLLIFNAVTIVNDTTITATTSVTGEYVGVITLTLKSAGTTVSTLATSSS